MLQDKLDQALQHRPKPEELIKEGILTRECFHTLSCALRSSIAADEAPPSK